MRVKMKRGWDDLAVIPLDNYFQWMTAGGTALHWIDERHTKTVYLSLFFSPTFPLRLSSSSLRLSLLLPVSPSHPFIMWCCCHRSERRGVCLCERPVDMTPQATVSETAHALAHLPCCHCAIFNTLYCSIYKFILQYLLQQSLLLEHLGDWLTHYLISISIVNVRLDSTASG